MRFYQYITEGNDIVNIINKLSNMTYKKLEQFLRDQFDDFVDTVRSVDLEVHVLSLINKHFDTRYRSLDDVSERRVPALSESDTINEDLAHWWDVVKTDLFPTLSFYPALTAWLEVDKLLRGQDMNVRVLVIYAGFWLLLISGKYIKGWHDWKKQNPEEYEKEKQQGKGGLI